MRRRLVRHVAVVCAMAAAASGEARIFIGSYGCHERPEPEEEDEEDGYGAAHLEFMLKEERGG